MTGQKDVDGYAARRQHVFMLFDEKVFTVEVVTNTQNDRLRARDAGICLKVAVVISARCSVVGPQSLLMELSSLLIYIEEGVKVNTQAYIKMLTEKLLPWITESFGNRYVFTPYIEFDKAAVQRSYQQSYGEKVVASLKFRYQPNGQCYLVHLKE